VIILHVQYINIYYLHQVCWWILCRIMMLLLLLSSLSSVVSTWPLCCPPVDGHQLLSTFSAIKDTAPPLEGSFNGICYTNSRFTY